MKDKIKKYKILLDIYNEIVIVYIGDKVQDVFKKVISDYDISDVPEEDYAYDTASVDTIFNKKEGLSHVIISLPSNANTNMVAHECFHATWRLLENKGFIPTTDTQEPFAYLLGFLTEKVTGLINKWKV